MSAPVLEPYDSPPPPCFSDLRPTPNLRKLTGVHMIIVSKMTLWDSRFFFDHAVEIWWSCIRTDKLSAMGTHIGANLLKIQKVNWVNLDLKSPSEGNIATILIYVSLNLFSSPICKLGMIVSRACKHHPLHRDVALNAYLNARRPCAHGELHFNQRR